MKRRREWRVTSCGTEGRSAWQTVRLCTAVYLAGKVQKGQIVGVLLERRVGVHGAQALRHGEVPRMFSCGCKQSGNECMMGDDEKTRGRCGRSAHLAWPAT